VGTPGLQLVLAADRAGSVGAGDPILYRGYQVGRIEETTFDASSRQVRHRVFIDSPYDELVDQATRFWNASGLTLDASAEGVRLEVGSLQSLLAGGVVFGLPGGRDPQGPVEQGAEFRLYDSYESTFEEVFERHVDYVVSFTQSIRGLVAGATVEYRGVRVGEVRAIMLAELARSGRRGAGDPIPVLIRLEPGRMELGDTEESVAALELSIEVGVVRGLRASLQPGNLLTGNLLVSLDFFRGAGPAKMGSYAGYPTIPTEAGGLLRIERQVIALLAKLNELPLDETMRELNGTIAEMRALIASDTVADLPASLDAALDELTAVLSALSPDSPIYDRLDRTVTELNRTLQSLETTARTLGDQPSSILFSAPIQPDPEPRGRP
jgi:paraquat-inducible protein B